MISWWPDLFLRCQNSREYIKLWTRKCSVRLAAHRSHLGAGAEEKNRSPGKTGIVVRVATVRFAAAGFTIQFRWNKSNLKYIV